MHTVMAAVVQGEQQQVARQRTITQGSGYSGPGSSRGQEVGTRGSRGHSYNTYTGITQDDSDTELLQPQERTRQKKFSKHFKDLPGEIVSFSKFSLDMSPACDCPTVTVRNILRLCGRHPAPGSPLRHRQLPRLPLQRVRLRDKGEPRAA